MAHNDSPFVLDDGIVLTHLQEHIKNSGPCPVGGRQQPFETLQHPELIQALLNGRYATADSLLRKLTAPLPPVDAMAACLCALGGSEKRMHAILDHCPPIPEFQFRGAGKTASLLNVAARFNRHKMLDLLLKRGADPNGGPTPETAVPPLEAAFCSNAYSSLERLLKAPDLRPELTERMLKHWASLQSDPFETYPMELMCCQLLLEALTGEPVDLQDPFPIPSRLTLEDALNQLNLQLAAHICRKRPLSDAEKEAAVEYLSSDHRILFLDEWAMGFHRSQHRQHAEFLLSVLNRCPELLHLPDLRFPIVSTALVPNKPDKALQALVAQLEDGPVYLKELCAAKGVYAGGLPVPRLLSHFTLSRYLFPRWQERLGRRFVPTMDVSADLYLPFMDDEEVQQVLEYIDFTGERPADHLSPVGEQFLLYAPEAFLPALLQPGGLLMRESPHALLDACQELPVARRNLLLPHLHRTVDYEL